MCLGYRQGMDAATGAGYCADIVRLAVFLRRLVPATLLFEFFEAIFGKIEWAFLTAPRYQGNGSHGQTKAGSTAAFVHCGCPLRWLHEKLMQHNCCLSAMPLYLAMAIAQMWPHRFAKIVD